MTDADRILDHISVVFSPPGDGTQCRDFYPRDHDGAEGAVKASAVFAAERALEGVANTTFHFLDGTWWEFNAVPLGE